MSKYTEIGSVTWTNEELKAAIPEFLELHKTRPLPDNQGGMRSPHMFATWFMLKKLNPDTVIESGVWKGQGTWLIEKTLPNAKVYSIDVELGLREYISERATYFDKDFSVIDWSFIKNKENVLLFFDDHQNGFNRVPQAKKMGFKHFIFEDNYSGDRGDCYSLKKAFEETGHRPDMNNVSFFKKIMNTLRGRNQTSIPPNKEDAKYLRDVLSVYYEFPPVFIKEKTRWGVDWMSNYPTKNPLYSTIEKPYLEIFDKEATQYTWICYAELK